MEHTTGRLVVYGRSGGQYAIEGGQSDVEFWERDYFSVGGFFGSYGPNVFAAAPDLYEALADVLDDLEIGAHPHLHIDVIRAALAKARGETE